MIAMNGVETDIEALANGADVDVNINENTLFDTAVVLNTRWYCFFSVFKYFFSCYGNIVVEINQCYYCGRWYKWSKHCMNRVCIRLSHPAAARLRLVLNAVTPATKFFSTGYVLIPTLILDRFCLQTNQPWCPLNPSKPPAAQSNSLPPHRNGN